LLAVFRVFPRRQTVNMHLAADLFKRGDVAVRVETWVQARLGHPPIFQRTVASLVERDNICAA